MRKKEKKVKTKFRTIQYMLDTKDMIELEKGYLPVIFLKPVEMKPKTFYKKHLNILVKKGYYMFSVDCGEDKVYFISKLQKILSRARKVITESKIIWDIEKREEV